MLKEKLLYSEDEFIEKLAHESAMASAIASLKESLVKSGREAEYILNSYYQYKEKALYDILKNYTIEAVKIIKEED